MKEQDATENDITKNLKFDDKIDVDDDDDAFEDSKGELEEVTDFSTPIKFKSTFGRIVAKSESRSRSRSTSTKRQYPSSDTEDVNKKKKSMMSNLPAPRKSGIPAASQ